MQGIRLRVEPSHLPARPPRDARGEGPRVPPSAAVRPGPPAEPRPARITRRTAQAGSRRGGQDRARRRTGQGRCRPGPTRSIPEAKRRWASDTIEAWGRWFAGVVVARRFRPDAADQYDEGVIDARMLERITAKLRPQ